MCCVSPTRNPSNDMSVTTPTSDQVDERTSLIGTYSSSVVAYSGPEEAVHPSCLHEADIERIERPGITTANTTAFAGGWLFLGTGRSLAEGGPASILICYSIVSGIVYITLLLLGEMATQYPVAGSFNAYATRFVDNSYGFALSWNYWLNDAISVASDLTAAQLVLAYWVDRDTWVISLVFLIFLLAVNAFSVGAYGELEYWISSLKMLTIVAFIITGVFVNIGINKSHTYIGTSNWRIPGAPFVGGFGGFAKVFVTASFAYGGTESLGITAGETKNPTRNMPRVVKFVFFRILLFYILSILLIGLNVPWDYPNLSNQEITTSPFTLVFAQAGSTVAASFMNTVVLTSVLSAGNHALFAGTRVLHNLSLHSHAPTFFARTNRHGVPYVSLLATASISGLCFASRYVGSGQLWVWLQNLVGVSNQIAWFSIGLSSWRFRRAWILQGRDRSELKFQGAQWTWGWGPPFVVVSVFAIIIIQGYSSIIPQFSPINFVSLYLQLPSMLILIIGWKLVHRIRSPDLSLIDLHAEEHVDAKDDWRDDAEREQRTKGNLGWAWRTWYLMA
ncbi:amino acid permease-domain-containing protein [Gautieria morchelliformis]|nr:amino acid permease-domain-containing protein [Gautieria morchelliformis]